MVINQFASHCRTAIFNTIFVVEVTFSSSNLSRATSDWLKPEFDQFEFKFLISDGREQSFTVNGRVVDRFAFFA